MFLVSDNCGNVNNTINVPVQEDDQVGRRQQGVSPLCMEESSDDKKHPKREGGQASSSTSASDSTTTVVETISDPDSRPLLEHSHNVSCRSVAGSKQNSAIAQGPSLIQNDKTKEYQARTGYLKRLLCCFSTK